MDTKVQIYITRSHGHGSMICRPLTDPGSVWVCDGKLAYGILSMPRGLEQLVELAEQLRVLAYDRLRIEPRRQRGLLADIASGMSAGLLQPVEAIELTATLRDGADPSVAGSWTIQPPRGDSFALTELLEAIKSAGPVEPKHEPVATEPKVPKRDPARWRLPRIDVMISRYPALEQFARECGYIDEHTRVIERASMADVRGKHVLGVLPLHMAAKAKSISEIPLRGVKLSEATTVEQLQAAAGEPKTYMPPSIGWSPVNTEIGVTLEPHPNGRDQIVRGGNRTAGGRYYVEPFAMRGLVDFDTRDCGYYSDGGSWTVQGWVTVDQAALDRGEIELSTEMLPERRTAYEAACKREGLEPLPWRPAISVPVAVVMAIEWVDLDGYFAPASQFGIGRGVALQQEEPLVIFPDGQRCRIVVRRYNGDERNESLCMLPDNGDSRNKNEADLIPIVEAELARRVETWKASA